MAFAEILAKGIKMKSAFDAATNSAKGFAGGIEAGTKAADGLSTALGIAGKTNPYLAAISFAADAVRAIDGVINEVLSFSNSFTKIEANAYRTARSMGMVGQQATAYNKALREQVIEVGSAYGYNSKQLADWQKNYASAIGRNVMLSKQQVAAMSQMNRMTNDDGTAQQLVTAMDKLGVGVEGSSVYMFQMQEQAKKFGLNVDKTTKDFAANIEKASKASFRNGVKDIMAMTLNAQRLKISMDSTLAAADKLSTIQGSIETSAQLQMLGGSFAQFGSNPMGLMFKAMADPRALQEDIAKMTGGMAQYNAKTGEATIDPVMMMELKQAAQSLGMSADEFVNSAKAQAQNKVIDSEINSAGNLSFAHGDSQKAKENRALIEDLSRGNVGENGEHQITYYDEKGNEVTKDLKDVTEEDLKIAKDQQLTDKEMYADVNDIKTILERKYGEVARGTMSVEEQEAGAKGGYEATKASAEDAPMTGAKGIMGWLDDAGRSVSSWIDNALGHLFSNGGIVHAAEGTIVPGNDTEGDHVPAMVNSGEMILTPQQQATMFAALNYQNFAQLGKIGASKGYDAAKTIARFNPTKFGIKDVLKDPKFFKELAQDKLGESVSKLSEKFPETAKRVEDFGKQVTNVKNGFTDLGKTTVDAVKNSKVVTKTTEVVNKTANAVKDANKAVADFAKGKANQAVTAIKSTNTYQKVASKVGNVKLQAQLAKMEATSKISDWYKGSQLKEIVGKGRAANTAAKNVVTKGASVAKTAAKELSGKAWNATKSGLGKAASKIGSSAVVKGAGRVLAADSSRLFASVATLGGRVGGTGLMKAAAKAGRNVPLLGTLVSAGMAINGVAKANSNFAQQKEEIENSNLSEADKKKALDKATEERDAGRGEAVGSATGAVAGGALGAAALSFIPGVGTAIGGIVGSYLGEKLGGVLGKTVGPVIGKAYKGVKNLLFGDEEKEKAQFSDEELQDPQLMQKAASATIKIYEMMLKKEGGGLVGKAVKGAMSIATAPVRLLGKVAGGIVDGVSSLFGGGKDESASGATNEKEMSIAAQSVTVNQTSTAKGANNAIDPIRMAEIKHTANVLNINPSDLMQSAQIKPLQEIGKRENINPNTTNQSIREQFAPKLDNIKIDVSGTIKLDLGGQTANVDAKKLMNNQAFITQLTDVITKRMSEMANGGKLNKESHKVNTSSIYGHQNK